MGDTNHERRKVGALIAGEIAPFCYLDPFGEALLSDLAFASLSGHFLDFVSLARIAPAKFRARCENGLARLLRVRRTRNAADAGLLSLPAE